MAQSNIPINYKSPSRRTSDIGQWRQALLASDAGKHKVLYDLYDDLLIDGVLSDAYDKRVEAITNAELRFLSDSEEAEKQMSDFIDTTGFEALLKCIMNTRFYGRAGGEFVFTPEGFKFMEFPAKHISLETRSIITRDTDDYGIPYDKDPFVLVLGERYNKGLFLKTAPLVIYKRGGFGDWSQWIELFGMPQRVGKYSAHDTATRLMLEQALSEAGAAPWVVVPKEAEVETNNNGQGGNGSSYNDFRNACNEEVLITVLGQTMTTLDGSSRSQSETHKDVEESKNRNDRKFVERILNEIVKPMLEKRGLPAGKGRFVFPESIAELSVADLVQLSGIIDIPVGFIRDKYAIPEPNDGEEIAQRKNSPVGFAPTHQVEENDKPLPANKKVKLFDRVLNFFALAPANTGAYPYTYLTLADDVTPSPIDKALIKWVWDNKGGMRFNTELFHYVSHNLIEGLNKGFTSEPLSAPAFDYHRDTPGFISAMEMNLFRFSAAKTVAEVEMLNRTLRESSTYADFEKRASKLCIQFNKVWQRTEYNTAVNAARAADTYWRLQSQSATFPYWQYVTMDDEKVRKKHEELHGLILPFHDQRWQKIFPPNDWNCRCRVRPLMKHELPPEYQHKDMATRADTFIGSDNFKKATKNGWGINRGVNALVFEENQSYIKKVSQGEKVIDNLSALDYDLKTMLQNIASSTTVFHAYKGSAEMWFAAHKKDGAAVVTDHKGRPLVVTWKNFNSHTTGKHLDRVELLDEMKNILKQPDEVWLNKYSGKFNNYVFLKYYADGAYVVVTKLEKGQHEVSTWFKIEMQPKNKSHVTESSSPRELANDPRFKYRMGMLIYNKSNQ